MYTLPEEQSNSLGMSCPALAVNRTSPSRSSTKNEERLERQREIDAVPYSGNDERDFDEVMRGLQDKKPFNLKTEERRMARLSSVLPI